MMMTIVVLISASLKILKSQISLCKGLKGVAKGGRVQQRSVVDKKTQRRTKQNKHRFGKHL